MRPRDLPPVAISERWNVLPTDTSLKLHIKPRSNASFEGFKQLRLLSNDCQPLLDAVTNMVRIMRWDTNLQMKLNLMVAWIAPNCTFSSDRVEVLNSSTKTRIMLWMIRILRVLRVIMDSIVINENKLPNGVDFGCVSTELTKNNGDDKIQDDFVQGTTLHGKSYTPKRLNVYLGWFQQQNISQIDEKNEKP